VIDNERSLHIGDTDDVWGRITERYGADLTAAGVQLRIITPDGTVGGWAAPQTTDTTQATTGILRASVRYTPAATGRHTLQAKLTPAGRTAILTLGTFNVITP